MTRLTLDAIGITKTTLAWCIDAHPQARLQLSAAFAFWAIVQYDFSKFTLLSRSAVIIAAATSPWQFYAGSTVWHAWWCATVALLACSA